MPSDLLYDGGLLTRLTAARKLCLQCRRSVLRRREDYKANDNARMKWEKGRIMFGRRGSKHRKRRRIIKDKNKRSGEK